MNIKPFGMGVHKNQKHVAHEGSHKMKVQSAPWLRRPFPGVKGGNSWGRAELLAHQTRLDYRLTISASIPGHQLDIGMGKSFHLACTQVSIMELFQQWLSTLRRDNDVGSPQEAAIKNTELVSWPTRESKSVDTGEDRVFGCPLLDGLGINCQGGQMIHYSNDVCWDTVI